jgi:DNA-directed RNA polymerase specialized sigma24 family protein
MGIDDPMLQEDIAQDTWAKLVAKSKAGKMPNHPLAWLMTVARRRALEIIEREERMREWEQKATDRNQATGDHPFRLDDAIAAVKGRLSNREQQILLASQRCRTDAQLAAALGCPTSGAADEARRRVKKRVIRILGEEVDVSFLFRVTPDVEAPGLVPPVRQVPAEIDWDSALDAEPRSPDSAEATLERLSIVDRIGSTARTRVGTVPLLGSFAALFDGLMAEGDAGSEGEWSCALGLVSEDIVDLRLGELTVLELNPGIAVMVADLLGLEARDLTLMGLGDVGLRPVQGDSTLTLGESLLPSAEADLRVEAIMAEAGAQAMAMG